jgi:hypothetical protein
MRAVLTWLISIGGIGSVTTLGCIAVGAVCWNLTPVRQAAFWLAAVAAVGTGLYTKGYSDGRIEEKVEWQAAEQRAVDRGQAARRDADRAVRDRGQGAGRMSDDEFRRD